MTTATSAALRGTLEDFGAEEILQFLAGTKKTGALVLSGDCTGTVWFADGEVYGADATTSLPLRDAVIAAGLVTDEQWDRAWKDATDGRAAVHRSRGARVSSTRTSSIDWSSHASSTRCSSSS